MDKIISLVSILLTFVSLVFAYITVYRNRKKDTESRIALEKQKQVEESLLTASVKRIEEGIEEIKTKQTNQDKKSEDLLVVVTKHEVVLGDLSRRMDEVEGCVYKK